MNDPANVIVRDTIVNPCSKSNSKFPSVLSPLIWMIDNQIGVPATAAIDTITCRQNSLLRYNCSSTSDSNTSNGCTRKYVRNLSSI